MTTLTYNHLTNECVVTFPSGKTTIVEHWRGEVLESSLVNSQSTFPVLPEEDFEVIHIR